MKRRFVESVGFRKRVDGEDDKDLLKRIQDEILQDPTHETLVQGTGGIRKIRVGGHKRGKSGSYRVFYLDLPAEEITHLMFLLLKGERENINADEKKELKGEIENLKKEARKGRKRS